MPADTQSQSKVENIIVICVYTAISRAMRDLYSELILTIPMRTGELAKHILLDRVQDSRLPISFDVVVIDSDYIEVVELGRAAKPISSTSSSTSKGKGVRSGDKLVYNIPEHTRRIHGKLAKVVAHVRVYTNAQPVGSINEFGLKTYVTFVNEFPAIKGKNYVRDGINDVFIPRYKEYVNEEIGYKVGEIESILEG
jgi:hypothetical protein